MITANADDFVLKRARSLTFLVDPGLHRGPKTVLHNGMSPSNLEVVLESNKRRPEQTSVLSLTMWTLPKNRHPVAHTYTSQRYTAQMLHDSAFAHHGFTAKRSPMRETGQRCTGRSWVTSAVSLRKRERVGEKKRKKARVTAIF